MNAKFIFYSIKCYGIRGIVDFIVRKLRGNPLDDLLKRKTNSTTPISGITLIGNLDGPGSLSKVMRDFIIMLRKADIPCQALNTPCANPIPASEYAHLITPPDEFVANKYTDIVTMRHFFDIKDPHCRCSAIEFWEFEDGVKEYQPEILGIKNIVAMSDFNLDVFKKTAPDSNIRKILYPFQFIHGPLAPTSEVRCRYGIPADAFVVFFNFDYQSSYYRKNPEAIMQAFAKSIANKRDARLVFKTMGAKKRQSMSDRLHAFAKELGIAERLVTIDNFIPQEDLVNLTNACDVYISLHRGEGFGLGIAEAMTLGKPVIVTDYSSTTEFCNAGNALLIPYMMVGVRPEQIDADAYAHVTRWAEPDIDAAAASLQKLYDNPQLRQKLGENGRHFIAEHFSVENFRKSVKEFLAC